MKDIQVQDPGLTCLGVTPIHSVRVDKFEDRVSLEFYTSDAGELVQIGNSVEIDLETWNVIKREL